MVSLWTMISETNTNTTTKISNKTKITKRETTSLRTQDPRTQKLKTNLRLYRRQLTRKMRLKPSQLNLLNSQRLKSRLLEIWSLTTPRKMKTSMDRIKKR